MNHQIKLSFNIATCLALVGFKGIRVPALPNPVVHRVTLVVTVYNMFMGLHWKPVLSIFVFQKLHFNQLLFLWFGGFFCKLDHCARNFGGTVD